MLFAHIGLPQTASQPFKIVTAEVEGVGAAGPEDPRVLGCDALRPATNGAAGVSIAHPGVSLEWVRTSMRAGLETPSVDVDKGRIQRTQYCRAQIRDADMEGSGDTYHIPCEYSLRDPVDVTHAGC